MRRLYVLLSVAAVCARTCAAGESVMASRPWVTNYVEGVISEFNPEVDVDVQDDGVAFIVCGQTLYAEYATVTSLVVRAASSAMNGAGYYDGMILPIDQGMAPAASNLYASAAFTDGAMTVYASETNLYWIADTRVGEYPAGTVFRSAIWDGSAYLVAPGGHPTNAAICRLTWTLIQPTYAAEIREGVW